MKKFSSILLSLILMISVVSSIMMPQAVAQAATTDEFSQGDFTVNIVELERPTMLNNGEYFRLRGIFTANKTIHTLIIKVNDENQFTTNIYYTKEINATSFALSDYASNINFANLPSGVFNLNISVIDNSNNIISLDREFHILGKADEPYHITDECDIQVSEGDASAVTDQSDETGWANGEMTINIPDGKHIDGIGIKWFLTINKYSIKSYDAKGKLLKTYKNGGYKKLHKYYQLDENTKKIVIKLKQNRDDNRGICQLRVYERGKVGVSVEQWQDAQIGECDVMVISSHRDDELLFFGGTIPYYSQVQNKNVYVMYVSGIERVRCRESLAGLWAMGIKTYPIVMSYEGGYHSGVEDTLESWGGESAVLDKMVEKIRKYRPKVIVSHSPEGEYGHPSHRTTSYLVQKAVQMAGDRTRCFDSFNKYSTWEVQKLYLHEYPENQITMDWDARYDTIGEKSAYELATIGFDQHRSQHGRWSMDCPAVLAHPNNLFGLAYTTVGEDVVKNDFYENVDETTPHSKITYRK